MKEWNYLTVSTVDKWMFSSTLWDGCLEASTTSVVKWLFLSGYHAIAKLLINDVRNESLGVLCLIWQPRFRHVPGETQGRSSRRHAYRVSGMAMRVQSRCFSPYVSWKAASAGEATTDSLSPAHPFLPSLTISLSTLVSILQTFKRMYCVIRKHVHWPENGAAIA